MTNPGGEMRVPTGRLRRIAMIAYTNYETDPRCRREATLAASDGWDVHFFALSHDKKRHRSRIEGITLHKLPVERYRGGSASAYVMSYLRFLMVAAWAVDRQFDGAHFDVVHVNTMPDFMALTALVPRLRGAKVILDIHDVMPEIYMTKFGLPSSHWRIKLIKAVEVFSARIAHRVLTAEHPKAELLARHGIPTAKISVLLNLPDDVFFAPVFSLDNPFAGLRCISEVDAFRLIYHGTLAHRLGMDIAINSMPAVLDRIPAARLQLFGDGDHLLDLHALAEKLELGGHVWFSDEFRPIEQIIPDIRCAHLAVLPTRHEVSTDYMLPTKLLEYLAFGIPAVFTPTLTVRHYFGDKHPLYLEDPDPASTAEKILWVAENYEIAKALTAELQDRWFSRFHWPEHKKSYLELLASLAGG
jgi:glycosyltransferase involved in cell wall biosynthesis